MNSFVWSSPRCEQRSVSEKFKMIIYASAGNQTSDPLVSIVMHLRGHEHFSPTKFRKHPLNGSVVKADFVLPYIYMH